MNTLGIFLCMCVEKQNISVVFEDNFFFTSHLVPISKPKLHSGINYEKIGILRIRTVYLKG